MKFLLFIGCLVLFCGAVGVNSQTPARPKASQTVAQAQTARSTPAYAEVILRRAEIESELEGLLLDFTEDYPKVKQSRFGLANLRKQADMLLAVKPAEHSRLTLALGKLLVRRNDLETDLWVLQQSFADEHPDVKRARKKVEIFERAIKEILG